MGRRRGEEVAPRGFEGLAFKLLAKTSVICYAKRKIRSGTPERSMLSVVTPSCDLLLQVPFEADLKI